MPNSLKVRLSKLRYKRQITNEEYQELIAKLDGHDKVIRAEGAREFAKWLEDTYWIELSISNDVCHNYDCDEVIKEYESYKKEQK